MDGKSILGSLCSKLCTVFHFSALGRQPLVSNSSFFFVICHENIASAADSDRAGALKTHRL